MPEIDSSEPVDTPASDGPVEVRDDTKIPELRRSSRNTPVVDFSKYFS